jgi:hypothetical protein
MENLAATTSNGTKVMIIERKGERIARLHLYLDLPVGDDTAALRQVLDALVQVAYPPQPGDEDLLGRLHALIGELHDQDDARKVPGGAS